MMVGPQSRVAQIEEKLKQHESVIAELRAGAAEFGEFRGEVRDCFRELRVELRDLRQQMDRRFERMDHKIDRHFMWTVALLASMLVAVVRSFYQ
jgi:septal ring factor EnvC (AmiA/AmiB activator)